MPLLQCRVVQETLPSKQMYDFEANGVLNVCRVATAAPLQRSSRGCSMPQTRSCTPWTLFSKSCTTSASHLQRPSPITCVFAFAVQCCFPFCCFLYRAIFGKFLASQWKVSCSVQLCSAAVLSIYSTTLPHSALHLVRSSVRLVLCCSSSVHSLEAESMQRHW